MGRQRKGLHMNTCVYVYTHLCVVWEAQMVGNSERRANGNYLY